jgi:drug/metabolite transporter (DMT)-like permease
LRAGRRAWYGPRVTSDTRVSDATFVLLLVLAMIGWGGTWTSGHVIAGITSLELLVFWRFVLTSVSLVPVLLFAREPFAVPWASVPGLVGAAVLMAAYNFLFLGGVRTGLAGTGGVIVTSLNPVLTFLATRLIERRRPAPLEIAGVILGIAGGAVLLRVWIFSPADLVASGNLFFVLAAVTWSALTLVSHRVQRRVGFLSYSFYVNALSTALILPFAAVQGFAVRADRPGFFWLNLAYLAIVGTSFATTVFFRAARRLGAHRASSFIFLVPALAPIISWLAIGERPETATLLGGPLAVAAVYLINRGGRIPDTEGAAG